MDLPDYYLLKGEYFVLKNKIKSQINSDYVNFEEYCIYFRFF